MCLGLAACLLPFCMCDVLLRVKCSANPGMICASFSLQEEELDEAELAGFESSALTLWCGNSASDHIVQVGVRGVLWP